MNLANNLGSGRHSIYRSCKTDAGADNRNYELGGARLKYVLNEFGEEVYVEKSLGAHTEFPHFFVPGKEDLALMTELYDKYTAEVKDIHANPFETIIQGKPVTLFVEVDLSQLDGSMIKTCCGLKGLSNPVQTNHLKCVLNSLGFMNQQCKVGRLPVEGSSIPNSSSKIHPLEKIVIHQGFRYTDMFFILHRSSRLCFDLTGIFVHFLFFSSNHCPWITRPTL